MIGDDDRLAIDAVNWRRVFPWLSLARSFRMALGPGKLALAVIALLATSVGWWAIGSVFRGSDDNSVEDIRDNVHWPWREDSLSLTDFEEQFDPSHPRQNIVLSTAVYYVRPGLDLFEIVETEVEVRSESTVEPDQQVPRGVNRAQQKTHDDSSNAAQAQVETQVIEQPISFWAFVLAALKTVWMIAVWTIIGGAIARISVVEFTQDRRTSMMEGLRYSVTRWKAFTGAPGVMLTGILMASIPVMIIGLVSRPGSFFYAISGLLWPLALLFGLIMAVLALGLLFGWPLMAVAVAAEREEDADAFGAISRAFEYGYQHIFKYLLYIMFVAVIGGVAWLVVTLVADQVLRLTAWGASWGAPDGPGSAADEMLSISQLEYQRTSGDISRVGSFLIRCWTAVIQTTVVAFAFTFFWSAASGIYVLLRNHAEGVPVSEVYMPEDVGPGLPPYSRDSAGVPVSKHEMPVSDDVPEADAKKNTSDAAKSEGTKPDDDDESSNQDDDANQNDANQ